MTTKNALAVRLQRLGVAEAKPIAQNLCETSSAEAAVTSCTTVESAPLFAPYYPRLRRRATDGTPVILIGPAATGKSTAVRQLAAEFGARLYTQQCYRSLGVEDIRGTRGLYGGMTTFEPGMLMQSLQDKRGWYFLEEINMADPAILSLLNNLLDDSGEISIPETGRTIRRGADWRFFAACNVGYQGTQELNQALVSRCVIIECEGFPPDVEAEILRREYPSLGARAESIVLAAEAVREARMNAMHEFDICLRTMLQLSEEYLATGSLHEAFRLVVLPKVGDPVTYGPVREGLLKAVEMLI